MSEFSGFVLCQSFICPSSLDVRVLWMSEFSGFVLCQSFTFVSITNIHAGPMFLCLNCSEFLLMSEF
ncbi:hypothetical protein HanIR_Chr14g0724481 [Helianthus annuus]|nr:hypothetical protein HanIR_Chr14g0724481 [Helianthus annuus]